MKRAKIFPKTFLYTLGLMLLIVLLSHVLLGFLLPNAYNAQQEQKLRADLRELTDQIVAGPPEERMQRVLGFASDWTADVAVSYGDFDLRLDLLSNGSDAEQREDGLDEVTVITSQTADGLQISLGGAPLGGADVFRVRNTFAGGEGQVTATVSRQHIEDAVRATLRILPYTGLLCAAISVAAALLFSRALTRPIERISAATRQMQEMDPTAQCPEDRQDEIGLLAGNVNNLYDTLLTAIRDLEREMAKAAAADIQKTNFLRAASHELKTPVTAISAMLENIILGIGKYRDRDAYLAKCKALTDDLTRMIREILDASRAEFAGEQPRTDFLLPDAVAAVAEPYQIIAKTRQVTFAVRTDAAASVNLPRTLIEKVISNILANAISYTEPEGSVTVCCEGNVLTVTNECEPIPPKHFTHIFEPFYRPDYGRGRETGGNGLGLYLVASILEALDLPYTFAPAEAVRGMTFRIDF